MGKFYLECKERFIKYAKIPTQSVHNGIDTPTSICQHDLAKVLYSELLEIKASDVRYDKLNCIVYATIPSNIDQPTKTIGVIAHMDTSPDVEGDVISPWVYQNYQGGDIVLNEKENIVMEERIFPNLKKYIGQDIIFTDGLSLLGGDDKAAITEIMVMANYFINNPQIKHGTIKIAFTPDEEVGGLARNLDLDYFGCEAAYTVDGDCVGYYSDETFNATEAQLTITGKSVHPGTAKNIMINAVSIGNEFINMLPLERPETTCGREGYYHPHYFNGDVESVKLYTLIRDHDFESFTNRINFINNCVTLLNQKYDNRIKLEWANGYLSMKRVVDKVPYLIPTLVEAIKESNVEPFHLAFRGGTDGSALSQRGLPCPNISAGYENGHSRSEFVPIQSMEKITEILINLFIKLGRI